MCLVTKQKNPLIASEDITVYKLLTEGNYSEHQKFHYDEGVLYETEIKNSNRHLFYDWNDEKEFKREKNIPIDTPIHKLNTYDVLWLGQGFHSSTSAKRFNNIIGTVHRCIIPKGSEYYLGWTELVISNKIVVYEEINNRDS